MEAHPHRGQRAAQHLGDVIPAEAVPCNKGQQFTVGIGEPGKRFGHGPQLELFIYAPHVILDRAELGLQPLSDTALALHAAPLVGKNPTGDSVQPRPCLLACGHIVHPPPRNGIRLGDDIHGDVHITRPAGGIRQNQSRVCVVYLFKAVGQSPSQRRRHGFMSGTGEPLQAVPREYRG